MIEGLHPYNEPRPEGRWVLKLVLAIAALAAVLAIFAQVAYAEGRSDWRDFRVHCVWKVGAWCKLYDGPPIQCKLIISPKKGPVEYEVWPADNIDEGMRRGRQRASALWGQRPAQELTFGLFCVNVTAENEEGVWKAQQKAPAGGGHAAAEWTK